CGNASAVTALPTLARIYSRLSSRLFSIAFECDEPDSNAGCRHISLDRVIMNVLTGVDRSPSGGGARKRQSDNDHARQRSPQANGPGHKSVSSGLASSLAQESAC